MKVKLTAEIIMNIPGELIDVSIARFDDNRTSGDIHKKYVKYKLDCIDNSKIFEFFSLFL